MEKIYKALRSRTVWAAIALFAVSGFDGVREFVPDALETPISGVLALMVAYFRVNPKQ